MSKLLGFQKLSPGMARARGDVDSGGSGSTYCRANGRTEDSFMHTSAHLHFNVMLAVEQPAKPREAVSQSGGRTAA